MPTQLDYLTTEHEQMMSMRRPWEPEWQEIRELVHPMGQDFNRQLTPGNRGRTDKILDGTAMWALEQLASGLHSFLTSPTDRWFSLGVKNYDYPNDAQALKWLEAVADMMYDVYNKPASNSNNSLHETYLSVGSFGTAIEYQEWDMELQHVRFTPFPLADCHIKENNKKMVDTIYRKIKWTTRQVNQEFGENRSPDKITKEKNQNKEWEIIHAVFPRTDRDASKLTQSNKPWASVWFCKEAKVVLRDSGYDYFPFHAPRWIKMPNETYGRSPAMICLPDIRLLNSMERVMLKSIQKIVDPPLMVPDDGFVMPIQTMPASLIFYDSAMNPDQMLRPLETKAQVEVGEEKMQQKRDHVMRCFYADWIQRQKKKERQTATEVMDDRDEMLQLMAPILGRQQSELLGPRIALTYNLMLRAGQIPPAPVSIQKKNLKIEYVSPAAKAQIARKGVNVTRFIEQLTPMAQIDPSVMDVIHPGRYAQEMAKIQDVTRNVLRTPEELAEIQDQKQKQQQAAAAAQTMEPVSNAIKNVAQAKDKGLDIEGMMSQAGLGQ